MDDMKVTLIYEPEERELKLFKRLIFKDSLK